MSSFIPHIVGLVVLTVSLWLLRSQLRNAPAVVYFMILLSLFISLVDATATGVALQIFSFKPATLLIKLTNSWGTLVVFVGLLALLKSAKLDWKPFKYFLSTVSLAIIALILFTDKVVAGYTVLNASLLRTVGDKYWIWAAYNQSLIVLLVVISIGTVVLHKDQEIRNRALLFSLLGLPAPLLMLLMTVAIRFGVVINFSVIFQTMLVTMPIAMVLLYSERHIINHYLVYIPFSQEARESVLFKKTIQGLSNKPLAEAMQKLELMLILKALAAAGGNMTKTGEALGIQLQTLRRKLRDHGYDDEARVRFMEKSPKEQALIISDAGICATPRSKQTASKCLEPNEI